MCFAGRVNLFLPSREWVSRDNQGLRWRSVAGAVGEYYGTPACDGDNMLRHPYAATFAEMLTRCRARDAWEEVQSTPAGSVEAHAAGRDTTTSQPPWSGRRSGAI
jgi:hypothetical protein